MLDGLKVKTRFPPNMFIDDEGVSFNARFGGVPMNVYVPMVAIMAVYARENGQGMGLGMEPGAELYAQQAVAEPEMQSSEPVEEAEEKPKRPSLKVVK